MKLGTIRKAVVAIVGAAATWAVSALTDDQVDLAEWAGLVAALATALGVYAIPNADTSTAPAADTPTAPALGDTV